MKTLIGMALGFAMMPATVGMIGLFAWANIRLQTSIGDVLAGVGVGLAVFCILGGIAINRIH